MKMKMTEAELQAVNESEIASWSYFSDLPVPLTIELGRIRLTAQAVLQLEVESLIGLSRSTGDGVDILAGKHRIGRGEIILIEDRSGVRITELQLLEHRR